MVGIDYAAGDKSRPYGCRIPNLKCEIPNKAQNPKSESQNDKSKRQELNKPKCQDPDDSCHPNAPAAEKKCSARLQHRAREGLHDFGKSHYNCV